MSLFLTDSPILSPVVADLEPPILQKSKISPFQLRVVTNLLQTSEQKYFRLVKQTISDWQEIVYDRLGRTRLEHQENPTARSLEEMQADSQEAKSYKVLCDEWKKFLKNPVLVDHRIMILTDSEQRIQGLSLISIKTDSIFVKTLMSAPWNIRMHGSNSAEHEQIRVRGVGTTLMRHIYDFATKEQKATIELKPLSGSYAFYKDHLKMTSSVRADGLYFTLDMARDVPEGFI
jgi:hypothetical protein